MKVLGICGSPNGEKSTTLYTLKQCLQSVEENGVETEYIDLSEYRFEGCHACGGCAKGLICSQNDDFTNKLLPVITNSSIKGVVFASPVYFGGVTAQMKAFMDRCFTLRKNNFVWENVVAGALTVGRSRNGGQELAAFDIVKNALIQGMIVVPDASPTSHFGCTGWSGAEGGIEGDAAAAAMAQNLGRRMAETVRKLHS